MPKIFNIKQTGYKIPEGAVYIGRVAPRYRLSSSKWSNPMTVREIRVLFPNYSIKEAYQEAVNWYRRYLEAKFEGCPKLKDEMKKELRGKDLACWCAPLPCHGVVLLELANSDIWE